MNTAWFWPLGSLAAIGSGTLAFVHGFHALRVRRLIRDTPTTRLRSLAMGMVELAGKVQARSRVTAPFSGRVCAWWEVELQTPRGSNRGVRDWHTVHRERSGSPFYLSDETGTALVYPQDADLRAGDVITEETHGFGVPEPYAGYMASRDLGLRHVWSVGAMRFRERVLEEGRIVYVLGHAHPKPHAVQVSMDDEVLEATGTEGIGAAHVRRHDGECAAVVRRDRHDVAFLISDRSEKTMAVEFGLRAIGGLVGGPLLTLFGVWCLIELARSGDLPLPQ